MADTPWRGDTGPGLRQVEVVLLVLAVAVLGCTAQHSESGAATTTETSTTPGPETAEATTGATEPLKGPPPPALVEPEHPGACSWTRHTRPATEIAPWSVEYVTLVETGEVVSYLDTDGSMTPSGWERHCTTISGPSP